MKAYFGLVMVLQFACGGAGDATGPDSLPSPDASPEGASGQAGDAAAQGGHAGASGTAGSAGKAGSSAGGQAGQAGGGGSTTGGNGGAQDGGAGSGGGQAGQGGSDPDSGLDASGPCPAPWNSPSMAYCRPLCDACWGDPQCSGMFNCLSACGSAGCQVLCEQQYPDGEAGYAAFVNCLKN